MNKLRTTLAVTGAIAGGVLAAASGAGILMVGACALAGAGAPSILITTGKVAARLTGKKIPFDADDAVTLGLTLTGLGAVATLFPDDQKKDPSNYVLAGSGLTGAGVAVQGIIQTCKGTRQAVENVRRNRPE